MKCCICGENTGKYGFNAQPIAKGLCCEKCSATKVMPARNLTTVEEDYIVMHNLSIGTCKMCLKKYGFNPICRSCKGKYKQYKAKAKPIEQIRLK